MIPVVSIVGKSGSGKTTFMEKLIPALRRRGWRVATIKHHAHPGFDFDVPGKDTWRHARAGSSTVLIVSPGKLAMIWDEIGREPSLEEAVAMIPDADIALTEGYHLARTPKVEVFRRGYSDEIRSSPELLLAIVGDVELEGAPAPVFDLEDAEGVAALIEEKIIVPAFGKDQLDFLVDGKSVRLDDDSREKLVELLEGFGGRAEKEVLVRWRRGSEKRMHG